MRHPGSYRMCSGGIVLSQEKRSEAEGLLERALGILRQALNPHHRMVVSAQQALVSVREVIEQFVQYSAWNNGTTCFMIQALCHTLRVKPNDIPSSFG